MNTNPRIEEEKLSDGSSAFNVIWNNGDEDGDDADCTISIAAFDETHAREICSMLEFVTFNMMNP